MRNLKEQKQSRQMSSIIESEKPKPDTESLHCTQEETCWCEGEAVCCQHEGGACEAADQEIELEDIARVVFLDHAQDLGKPLVCTVYGVIEHIDKTFINITSWHPTYEDDDDTNRTTYTIIRSCIRQLDVFN
jgi:hypothetical protein